MCSEANTKQVRNARTSSDQDAVGPNGISTIFHATRTPYTPSACSMLCAGCRPCDAYAYAHVRVLGRRQTGCKLMLCVCSCTRVVRCAHMCMLFAKVGRSKCKCEALHENNTCNMPDVFLLFCLGSNSYDAFVYGNFKLSRERDQLHEKRWPLSCPFRRSW